MPRGVKKEITYVGKALKAHEKVVKLEAELKAAKAELKVAYNEQVKEEKQASQRAKKEQTAQILKLIEQSGKTPEEIAALLKKS